MAHVTHTADGWRVAGESYASLRDALDAALAKVATKPKEPHLRDPDTGELNGAWRWLPATEEESEAIDGVRIDATAIEEMASSLNARATPIPIDGGPSSVVHGTAHDSGTRANGWAHFAVTVHGADGVRELYLWVELVPSVARDVDAGRLATGSVHFGCARIEGEDSPRGCVLVSHALTNRPAVTTLAPANSVRTDGLTGAWRSRSIAGRVLRNSFTSGEADMATKKVVREETQSDEEKKKDEEEESEETKAQRGPGQDALMAALQAKGVEVSEDMSPDDMMGLVAQMLADMGEAPAEESGEVAAARAKAEAALTVVRSEVASLRAQIAELEPLKAEKAVRDREAAIDAAMAKCGMRSAEQRKAFLAVAEKHGVDAGVDAIKAAHVPPTGAIVQPLSHVQRASDAPESQETRDITKEELEQARAMVPELRAQFPSEPNHMLLARAQKLVLKKR